MPNATRRVGRPPLSEEVLRERRAAILQVTLGLVAEVGTDNVKLRDVAARAGVSVGTLQHYFVTRDQILRDAFSQHAHAVVSTLQEAARSPVDPWERIRLLLQTITASPENLRQRCVLWIEFAAASLRDPELRRLMEDAYEGWREPLLSAVKEGIASGLFKPVLPPETAVSNLLALIDGLEMALALEIPGISNEQVFQQLHDVAAVLLGVTAPADGGGPEH